MQNGDRLEKAPPTTIEHSLTGDTQNLASCEFSNGKGVLNFRRLLTAEEGKVNTQREIMLGETTHFLWAHGTHSTLAYHQRSRGTRSLVIGQGAQQESSTGSDDSSTGSDSSNTGDSDDVEEHESSKSGSDDSSTGSDSSNAGDSDDVEEHESSKGGSDDSIDGVPKEQSRDDKGNQSVSHDASTSYSDSGHDYVLYIAIGAIGAAMLVVLVGVVIFVNVNRRKRDYNRHKDPASLNEGAVAVEMTDNPSTVTGAMEGQLATSVGQYAHPAVPKRPSNSKNSKKKHQKSSSVESQSDSAGLLYHTVGSMPDMSQISFEKELSSPRSQTNRSHRVRRTGKRSFDVPPSPMTQSAHGSSMFHEDTLVETPFGSGKVLYTRKFDQCQVIELSWKLAGGSSAMMYRFSKNENAK
eukprot:g2603.t1